MRSIIAALLAFGLVGCGYDERRLVQWCDKLKEQEIRVKLPGLRGPIKAVVEEVSTDKEACWYHIRLTDDEHIRPRRFFIHERHVL